MAVFTLPSYPYVFKLIKDVIPHPKDTDRQQVMAKYQLVKLHDRVGRMADTWEYSQVTLPRSRFSSALLRELLTDCASIVEVDDKTVLINHVYIERRLTPLNIYLTHATDEELEHAVFEYGNAIKELAAANIFPGDMLYKNFGVTRLNRVVFYDYDEIEYMTTCEFRSVPHARNDEDEMSHEAWYAVGAHDMFPEKWGTFLARRRSHSGGLHQAPRRSADARLLERAQVTYPSGANGECVSVSASSSIQYSFCRAACVRIGVPPADA